MSRSGRSRPNPLLPRAPMQRSHAREARHAGVGVLIDDFAEVRRAKALTGPRFCASRTASVIL